MAEIKRLNYFTSQFLVEKDFKDEQAYHTDMRRQHNRLLHSRGIVEGLEVSKTGPKEVSVSPGTAIDREGREIVLPSDPAPSPVNLTQFGPNATVYLTIAYQEVSDEADHYTSGGVDDYTRTTERPELEGTTSVDASAITLARITLDSNGDVDTIDPSVRTLAGAEIAPTSVDTDELADGAVTNEKIADSSVGSSKLYSNAVRSIHIAEADGTTGQNANSGAGVKTAHLQNEAITSDKIASNAVNSAKIASGSVGTSELATGAVTDTKIASNAVNAAKIASSSVGSSELATGAVTNTKIASNAVNAAKILNGSVGSSELASDAVTSAKLAQADGINSQSTSSGSGVKTGHLQDGAVTTEKLADNAVIDEKIANGSINEAKLDAGAKGKLVTNGNSHNHSGGDGGTISHSALQLDGGRNPHGTTASDVEALPNTGGTITGNLTLTGSAGRRLYLKDTRTNGGTLYLSAGSNYGHVFVQGANPLSLGNDNRGRILIRSNGEVAFTSLARFDGGKSGYVIDTFVNGSGKVLHTGDVVKLKPGGAIRFHGINNRIPIPEVTLADSENDPLVISIVDQEATPALDEPDRRTESEDPTFIPDGGELFGVTLGAYAHCKVDAGDAPIEVGDLLTSSANPGHAKKATDPRIGSIIGKALEPLSEGTGYISVFVNIQ